MLRSVLPTVLVCTLTTHTYMLSHLVCCRRRGVDYEEIVIPPGVPNLNISSNQVNDENQDFAYRQRFHQTASIQPMNDNDHTYRNVQILR